MPRAYLQWMKDQVARYAGTLRDVVILAPVYGLSMFTLMKDPRRTGSSGFWWMRPSPTS